MLDGAFDKERFDAILAKYAAHRAKMLADKVDCAKFLTWFIENYPESASLA